MKILKIYGDDMRQSTSFLVEMSSIEARRCFGLPIDGKLMEGLEGEPPAIMWDAIRDRSRRLGELLTAVADEKAFTKYGDIETQACQRCRELMGRERFVTKAGDIGYYAREFCSEACRSAELAEIAERVRKDREEQEQHTAMLKAAEVQP